MNLQDIRTRIADDAYAASFQTMGQYRSALLAAINNVVPAQAEQPSARVALSESDRKLLLEAWDYGQFSDDFDQPQAKTVRAALCAILTVPVAVLGEDVLMQAIADTAACGHVWASRALSNYRAAK